jgi:hypothetical protein
VSKPGGWLLVWLSLLLAGAGLAMQPAQPQPASIDDAVKAVVRIRGCNVVSCNVGLGSGVIIHPSGVILTAHHVTLTDPQNPLSPHIEDFIIELTDDAQTAPEARYRARLIAAKPSSDLALLRIHWDERTNRPLDVDEPLALAVLPLADTTPLRLGERLHILGYPLAGGRAINYTSVALGGFDENGALLKVQASLGEGNSGGPALVERDGRFVVAGVVIQRRGSLGEVGLLRNVRQLAGMEWLPGAQRVWAANLRVATHGSDEDATLVLTADLHALDFAGRTAHLLAYAFVADSRQSWNAPASRLPSSATGQLVLDYEFNSTSVVETAQRAIIQVRQMDLGRPPDQLLFRILIWDQATNSVLWEGQTWVQPQPDDSESSAPAPAPLASDTATPTTTATPEPTHTATASATPTDTETPTPPATPTNDLIGTATALAGEMATLIAATQNALPTAPPTETPTADLAQTATAIAANLATAVAATLTSQPTATSSPTDTDTLTTTPMPPATSPPTSTPTLAEVCTILQNVNLRPQPGTNNSPIRVLQRGEELITLGRSTDSDWLQVRVRTTSEEGWVSAGAQYVACGADRAGAGANQIAPTATQLVRPTPRPVVATPASPAVTSRPGLVYDFEDNGGWRRGDQAWGPATLLFAADNTFPGRLAGQLDYDIPASAGENNFLVYTRSGSALAIPGEPNALRMQVYGDGAGLLLNAWVQDAQGQVWQFSFGRIQHTGWRELVARLDPGLGWPNVRISGQTTTDAPIYPLRFYGFVVDGLDNQDYQGTLYFDDLFTASVALSSTGAATATPAPLNQTAEQSAGSIRCGADPARIAVGERATLWWEITEVQAVYLGGAGVAGIDSRQVSPNESTTYTLRIIMRDGKEQFCPIQVEVTPSE